MLGCPPRLTPDVVAKRVPRLPTGWPSEALAQDLVHNRTNIPIPPIRCVLNLNQYVSVIVMDYIPGITLAEAWPPWGSGRKFVWLSPCEAMSASSGPSHIPNLIFLDLFSRAKSLEYALCHAFLGPSDPPRAHSKPRKSSSSCSTMEWTKPRLPNCACTRGHCRTMALWFTPMWTWPCEI